MFSRSARPAVIAAVVATAASALPALASAQSYGYSGGYVPGYGGQTYRSDAYCTNERQNRTGTGALIGAGAGAVAGSQLAARGRRTEGSILGGVVGALIGGSVGRGSSDRCESYGYAPRPYASGSSYYNSGSGYYSSRGPWSSGYTQAPQVYYDDNSYGPYAASSQYYAPAEPYHDEYAYDPRYDDRRISQEDCRLAESRIRLPDGRSETRYVRTCRDASGRYRVVD